MHSIILFHRFCFMLYSLHIVDVLAQEFRFFVMKHRYAHKDRAGHFFLKRGHLRG